MGVHKQKSKLLTCVSYGQISQVPGCRSGNPRMADGRTSEAGIKPTVEDFNYRLGKKGASVGDGCLHAACCIWFLVYE
jgi:hypothetical protein